MALTQGSSPLTRGKPRGQAERPRGPGLIPAHAGKTLRTHHRSSSVRAHPRSRGENRDCWETEQMDLGSSPLTRGKPGRARSPIGQSRLIPAHAGKTLSSLVRRLSRRAHPRSRGENATRPFSTAASRGSSPLTRGKRLGEDVGAGTVRLIPAHAGKTRRICGTATPKWAHPRSRGENAHSRSRYANDGGSSPLTRGKLRVIDSASAADGAHPRSRGEN